jgi:3-hydroxypropanoate dehydrogenase
METPMTFAPGTRLNDDTLSQLYTEARTFSHWLPRSVDPSLLAELYDLVKFGPTSANCQPGRFWFVTSAAGKERLKPALAPGNLDKTMAAPVTVIVAYDTRFHDLLPQTFPHVDARSWFEGNDELIEPTARRNSSLQGGYLMIAARALGLDCGPMSGFDAALVDRTFFPDGRYRCNFLCNLGYGDRASLHGRSPRLAFDEACRLV